MEKGTKEFRNEYNRYVLKFLIDTIILVELNFLKQLD